MEDIKYKSIELTIFPGVSLDEATEKAIKLAFLHGCDIKFKFNDSVKTISYSYLEELLSNVEIYGKLNP